MTSADTRSVRPADATAMAIPLWTTVEGRPPYPPIARRSARADDTSASASGPASFGGTDFAKWNGMERRGLAAIPTNPRRLVPHNPGGSRSQRVQRRVRRRAAGVHVVDERAPRGLAVR